MKLTTGRFRDLSTDERMLGDVSEQIDDGDGRLPRSDFRHHTFAQRCVYICKIESSS